MAHYVPIPKDLNDIKEKFIMGFTKRQVICFGIGLVLGAPVYRRTCVLSHKSVYRNVGSYIRNGGCRCPCDTLRHLQEKRRVLGKAGQVYA